MPIQRAGGVEGAAHHEISPVIHCQAQRADCRRHSTLTLLLKFLIFRRTGLLSAVVASNRNNTDRMFEVCRAWLIRDDLEQFAILILEHEGETARLIILTSAPQEACKLHATGRIDRLINALGV